MIVLFVIFLNFTQFLFCKQATTYVLKNNNKVITYELSGTDNKKAAIVYELNQGRFGDNLISYICAKQLSLQVGAELLYVPFPYSDQLKLHILEKKYDETEIELYEQKILYNRNDAQHYPHNKDILYITDWHHQPILDMYDEDIKKEIKALISPLHDITYFTLPEHSISVALHIRSGKGFDQEKTRKKHPHRFLPLHYFSDQLKRILYMFPNQTLYVYIFTDDPNPACLINYFNTHVSSDLITYDYRKTDNMHNKNVLEDFFSMMHFDVLIRPASNFSGLAQYLGDHKVVILPEELHFTTKNSWYVDTVQVVVKINDQHKIFGNIRSSSAEMPIRL